MKINWLHVVLLTAVGLGLATVVTVMGWPTYTAGIGAVVMSLIYIALTWDRTKK